MFRYVDALCLLPLYMYPKETHTRARARTHTHTHRHAHRHAHTQAHIVIPTYIRVKVIKSLTYRDISYDLHPLCVSISGSCDQEPIMEMVTVNNIFLINAMIVTVFVVVILRDAVYVDL